MKMYELRSPHTMSPVFTSVPSAFTNRIAGGFPLATAVIDATGSHNNRSTTTAFGTTDRTLLEKYGFQIINNTKANPLVKDTDNSANSFIAKKNLIVRPDDKNMLLALDNYHYETADRIKLVKYSDPQMSIIDSLGDALRYGIYHLFPLRHDQPGTPDYVTIDNKFIRPGSEYLRPSPLFPGGPALEDIIKGDIEETDYAEW